MSIFDNAGKAKRGCAICAQRTSIRVEVRAQSIDRGARGSRTITRGRAFCVAHGEQIYRQLADEIAALGENSDGE